MTLDMNVLATTRIFFLITIILCLVWVSLVNSNAAEISSGVQSLIEAITNYSPTYVQRNSSGDVVSLTVTKQHVTDATLETIATLPRLERLHLFGNAYQRTFTRAGIAALRKSTNLADLGFSCFVVLPEGVFEEASRIPSVRHLTLEKADPATMEFSHLTNMVGLVELRILYSPAFGDDSIQLLTALRGLRVLELRYTAISARREDLIKKIPNLTKIVVR